MPTPAKALISNLTNKLAYCDECSPAVAFGFGGYPEGTLPRHTDPATKKTHAGKVVEIDPKESRPKDQSMEKFLAGLLAKYVTKK
jgi:hypothetical protein